MLAACRCGYTFAAAPCSAFFECTSVFFFTCASECSWWMDESRFSGALLCLFIQQTLGADNMKHDRRKRLENLVKSLIRLNDFSTTDAKTQCSETSPGYITRTIHQLADDGLLRRVLKKKQVLYRWSDTAPRKTLVLRWIDRKIEGLQIKHTAEEERPRERLLRNGPCELSNADLLAILMHTGVAGESAVTGGQRIANRFTARLPELSHCSHTELKAISPAATRNNYAKIMAGIELGRRVSRVERVPKIRQRSINSTRAAIDYCSEQFARLAYEAVQEEFHLVTLDTKHKPINKHRITIGTLDASLVHPREVFRAAIRDAASAVILVHNHPSGDPSPSREDIMVTHQLTEAGKILGISVLASQYCISIRETNLEQEAFDKNPNLQLISAQ